MDYKKEMLRYVADNMDELDKARCMRAWGNKEPIPYDCADRINDLCEEFCDDNDLPEGWWNNYYEDADEVFYELPE